LRKQKEVLDAIDGKLPFGTPRVEAFGENGEYVIERRLAGRPMPEVVRGLATEERAVAFRNYVAAIEPLGAITFPDRPYGQLIAEPALTASDWHDYLRRSLDRFAARNAATIAAEFGDVAALVADAVRLLGGVDPYPPKALVHGDYFPGNVLLGEHLRVSAVIDFSTFTLVGDPLLDAACASAFLEMNEPFTAADSALVRSLAIERFGNRLADAEPFYRAYFAFFLASPEYAQPPYPKLYAWSLANLAVLRRAE
jgi:aminoglycoside phosphotransferase (APT) family kinase protein